jgi:ribulose-phosphate 3-epimerase
VAVIAASILDADFSDLRREIERVADAGVDAFSLDVMDGHFVPRLTFGEFLVARIRTWVALPIEVHLMVERPDTHVRRMADAGADMVMFHLEAASDPEAVVEAIRAERRAVGLAVRLDTPVEAIPAELLEAVDVVNLVAVPLGWGGSASAADTFDRIAALRARIEELDTRTAIEVDGGVKPDNAVRYVRAGADMLTSGTGIYHAPDAAEAVATLRSSTAGPQDEAARGRLEPFLSMPSTHPIDDAGRRARLEELRAALDIPPEVWDPAGAKNPAVDG